MERKIKEIRRENLLALIAEFNGQVALSEAIDTKAAYISQIVTMRKTDKGTTRGIGDELASKIEKKLDKPPGWMDIDHNLQVKEGNETYSLNVGFFDNLSIRKLKILEMLHQLNESDTETVYMLLKSLTSRTNNQETKKVNNK